MHPFYLVETTTSDQLILQGAYFKPRKPGNKALLWTHGLTSNFYGDIELFNVLTERCDKEGFGFTAFNNRGHGQITGFRKIDQFNLKGYTHVNIGAGKENFADCIYDIDAGIEFLIKQGFREIVLIGHSTGANKVCYYAGLNSEENYFDKSKYPCYVIPAACPPSGGKAGIYNNKYKKYIIGTILASPISDHLDPSIDKSKLQQNLIRMMKLAQDNKGDQLVNDIFFFPITPNRFLSLFVPNSLEDQFDYGDPNPRFTYFSQIEKPLLVILGEKDEYIDRPAKNIKAVFDQHQHSANYKSVIIPNSNHGFDGKEKEVVDVIFNWVKSL